MANNSSSSTYYVSVEKLQIGLYVFIDLPWFQHPFTLNSFRISNEEQIRTLKSLGESRFRYDPKRSDADPDDPVETPSTEAPETTESDTPDEDLSPEFAARRKRIRALEAHRRRIEEVDKTYLKANGILRNLNRKLIERGEETLQEMDSLVDQMVTAFLKHPEVTLHVMGEKFSGAESYSHSLNVSVLSMMLSKGLGLSEEQAHSLGVGALLHDIGLAEIPERVLKKRPSEYTKPERDLRAMHCEFGVRLGKKLGLPPGILAIILQHHEMADGTGYPAGARLEKIAFPARIVSLVNFYDNLCNPTDLAQALTPHEALSFMFGQRRTKFDAAILQQMIRCLGVYPPGSIVSLSNDVVGLVLSVNPTKPLRPWIMAYDAKVPKEEAILLNLEQETELVIAKALRPALLPPAIHAYLSPRQRITYYFDSSVQATQGTK